MHSCLSVMQDNSLIPATSKSEPSSESSFNFTQMLVLTGFSQKLCDDNNVTDEKLLPSS